MGSRWLEMVEKKAYPGTISSVILSVIVMIMLLMPFYVANNRDRLRKGYGEFEYKEVMCFDINEIGNFDHNYFFIDPQNPTWPVYNQGNGAFIWRYFVQPYKKVTFVQSPVTMTYNSLEGTVNNYASGHTTPKPGTTFQLEGNECWFALEITWGEFLEFDVTRVDIFIDGFPITAVGGRLVSLYLSTGQHLRYGPIGTGCVIGEKTSIEVTVDDLLEINNLPSNEQIIIRFYEYEYTLVPSVDITFDMQWYYIEEIPIPTMDYMGIVMIGGGIFMVFCAILMLPMVTFRDIIGGIVGKRE